MAFKQKAKRTFYKKKDEEDVGQEEEEEDVGVESDHDDDDNETPKKKLKPTKTTTAVKKSTTSSNKDKSIELGGRRKISYSEFGGAPRIDIREFYEDKATKELKPGSKGISLTFEQFQAIADNIDTILTWTKNK